MDRPAFERLALEQLDAVYRLAHYLTRDPEAAEDLVQEVYVRAFRAGSQARFKGQALGMRAWLFRIAHNTFCSSVRKEAKAPIAAGRPDRAVDVGAGAALPLWDRAGLDWEMVDDVLKRAIDSLSLEHREVLLMWSVDQFKYREIAMILDIPIGTVMSRLHTARRLVAEALCEHGAGQRTSA